MIKFFLNRKLTIKEFVELYNSTKYFYPKLPLYIERALISSTIPSYHSDIKALFIPFIFLFLYHSFYDRLRIHFYLLHSDFFLLIFLVLFCKKYILSSTLRPALLEFSPEKWYNVKCIMINLLILINQFALLSDFLRRLKINSH